MLSLSLTPALAADDAIRQLYDTSFPVEERIPYDELIGLIDPMNLDFTAYYDNGRLVGMTIVCPLSDLNWFWYFAVAEPLRGRGYGQQILDQLTTRYAHSPLILDMESPAQPSSNTEQRLRRSRFYQRNGFRDTGVGRSFDGVDYTILLRGDGTFTQSDYDSVIARLHSYWKVKDEK